MPVELRQDLMEVLRVMTRSPRTVEEIRTKWEENNPPLIKVETSWISRTVLPNSSRKTAPPKELAEILRELTHLGLVKRSITRYLDGPLDKDTEIFSLADPKKT
jgi:hypothetical protein